jgi:dolichyl-phosphate-mannose-protein mannosyltransferase
LILDTERDRKFAAWGIAIVCAISVILRFWEIGRFNQFVFDEVYYAKFANNYLTNTKFFNSHPPLSQYLIAIGIWIGDRLPIGEDITNTLTGSLHSTFSYRWTNAVFGSLLLPLVARLAYQLMPSISFAFLATLFISLDGLFLVDSRYALNNIYLIFFGLLGQLFILLASKANVRNRQGWLLTAGISFGASIACKWNGFSFLFGIYILIIIAKIWVAIDEDIQIKNNSVLARLAKISATEIIPHLIVLPIITYSLLWIPHLIQNPTPNFIDVQWSIFNYHEQVGNGSEIHPYCANWYTWPLLMRPLAYHFEEDQPNHYYDVHAMGNPLLWWLALAAIFASIWIVIINYRWRSLSSGESIFNRLVVNQSALAPIQTANLRDLTVPIFIVVNYLVNLLPWIKVTRCLFIYHYMGAVLFAIMGLAWWVDLWLRSNSKSLQALGLTTIFSIAGAFVFWLPIYLGLSLNKTELSLRLWNFWIFKWI